MSRAPTPTDRLKCCKKVILYAAAREVVKNTFHQIAIHQYRGDATHVGQYVETTRPQRCDTSGLADMRRMMGTDLPHISRICGMRILRNDGKCRNASKRQSNDKITKTMPMFHNIGKTQIGIIYCAICLPLKLLVAFFLV